MIRNTSIFVATFVFGALIALVARAALHDPHTSNDVHTGGDAERAPMVGNALTPAVTARSASAPDHNQHASESSKAEEHSGHGAQPAPDADNASHAKKDGEKDDGKPVNTICAICGMEVDPNLPTATYQGKTIGFGCRMCPPKFKKNPDKYGPYYLRNELVP